MTQHDFLAFLDASHTFYGHWPNFEAMTQNLRLNTPRGAARWDSQLRSVLPSLLKKQFVKWEECSVRGCRHLELTPFGAEMLKAWNR
ncbi:MAG: hypothetical protein RB191_24895, partial [Terriglobia bacterium]|nr:hypothetical protein [Terriglobia bacterium]